MVGALLFAAAAALGASEEEAVVRSASVAVAAEGGARGERRFTIRTQARAAPVAVDLGMESSSGPSAPARRAGFLGAELDLDGLSPHVALRASPEQDGVARFAAELGLRREGSAGAIGVALLGRTTTLRQCSSCPPSSLRALGLSLDADAEAAPGFRIGFNAAAFALDLARPRVRQDPWLPFGAQTLDWAERWEVGAAARRSFSHGSVGLHTGVSQPAGNVPLSPHGVIEGELELGVVTLSLVLGAQKLPALGWEAQAGLGLSVHTR